MTSKNPRRAALFKLVCLSLFTNSMGFTSSYSSPAKLPLHVGYDIHEVNIARRRPGASMLRMSSAEKQCQSEPRLTIEEEKELLRQAVEMRRITEVESDLLSISPVQAESSLADRARAAGYGDELDAFENAILEGQRARDLLVTRNMGLVHFCLTQIVGKRRNLNSLSREDLVQEGAIGLARAVDKWNPAIGGKFSTYAVYWIRAAILRCIEERDDMLRVPVHISQAVTSINKAAKRNGIDLSSENWRKADAAKILVEETGLSEKKFEEAMKARSRRYAGGYVAFETWMQKGSTLERDVPTVQAEEGLSSIETEHLRTTLSKYLRPREMEALSLRYGLVNQSTSHQETIKEKANRYLMEAEEELFGAKAAKKELPSKGRFGEAMSFNEVGKKMQVSAEYGRKLCHAALAKLRRAADEGHLEAAFLF